jgi:hypothetical protein
VAIPHASSAPRLHLVYSSTDKSALSTKSIVTRLSPTRLIAIIMASFTRSSSTTTAAAPALAGGGGGGGSAGHPAAAHAVPVNDGRLTPAQVAPAAYIQYRYSEATGIKLWNTASASLPAKWGVDSAGLFKFLEHVVDRQIQSGWGALGASIMMIPDGNGVPRHLVHHCGLLSMENIGAFTQMFMGQETRQVQNNLQLYYCIANTFTEAGHLRIV